MINAYTQTRHERRSTLYSDGGYQTRLAAALQSVEAAHSLVMEPCMCPEEHLQRIDKLDAALTDYWLIDCQVEAYLLRAREN